jgi:hypothetical protein
LKSQVCTILVPPGDSIYIQAQSGTLWFTLKNSTLKGQTFNFSVLEASTSIKLAYSKSSASSSCFFISPIVNLVP